MIRGSLLTANRIGPIAIGPAALGTGSWGGSLTTNCTFAVDPRPCTKAGTISSVTIKVNSFTGNIFIAVGPLNGTVFTVRDTSIISVSPGTVIAPVDLQVEAGDCIAVCWGSSGTQPQPYMISGFSDGLSVLYATTSSYAVSDIAPGGLVSVGSNIGANSGLCLFGTGTTDIGSQPPFPLLLDDFETGTIAAKWPVPSSTYTLQTTTIPGGSGFKILKGTSGALNNLTGLWFGKKPFKYRHKRGDVVSVDTSMLTPGAGNGMGMYLHGTWSVSDSTKLLYSGYTIFATDTTLYIYSYAAGSGTTVSSSSFASAGSYWRLRAYINPLDHPVNPGKAYAEMVNPTTGAVLASTTGTVTSANDYTNPGLAIGNTDLVKGGGSVFYYDDVTVESRN